MQRISAIIALLFFISFTFINEAVTCVLMPIPDECLEAFESCEDMFILEAEPTCIVVVSGCGGCEPPVTLIPDLDVDYPHEMMDNSGCEGCNFTPPETRPVIVEYRLFQYQHDNNAEIPENIIQIDIFENTHKGESINHCVHNSIPTTVLRC